MRGLFSFVFLLSFIALFSSMLLIFLNSQEKIDSQKRGMLLLEGINSNEMDLKNSFSQMLSCYSNIENEEVCALEILRWEINLNNKFKADGISLNAWFGGIDRFEFDEPMRKSLDGKAPRFCKYCHPLGEITIDFSKKPRFLLNSIIFSDGAGAKISKMALAKTPMALIEFSNGDIFFGGVVHFERQGINAIFLIPEGFS